MAYDNRVQQQNLNSSNRRLSTPSLLFCRSAPSKSPRLSEILSSYCCSNHPHKAAQYLEQPNIYYCEKCAITLASRGRSVMKLSKGVSKQSIEHTLADKLSSVTASLHSSQWFYGAQLQEINDYFTYVQQSLELQKNKCYRHILQQRTLVQEPARSVANHIAHLQHRLHSLHDEESLTLLKHEADALHCQDIQMRKIEFEGVPQSIFSLAQVIIQNYEQEAEEDAAFAKASPIGQGKQTSLKESIEEILAETNRQTGQTHSQNNIFTMEQDQQ